MTPLTAAQIAGLKLRAAADQLEESLRHLGEVYAYIGQHVEHPASAELMEAVRQSRGVIGQTIETHQILASVLIGDAAETL